MALSSWFHFAPPIPSPPFHCMGGVINMLCFLHFTNLKYRASVTAASHYWNHGKTVFQGGADKRGCSQGGEWYGPGWDLSLVSVHEAGELGHSSSAVTGSLTVRVPEAPCLGKALGKGSLLTDPTLLLLGCFKLTGQLPRHKLLYVTRLIAG